MNGKVVIDVPLQNDVSELFGILTCTLGHLWKPEGDIPTTAKALLEKNFTKGSVAIIRHVLGLDIKCEFVAIANLTHTSAVTEDLCFRDILKLSFPNTLTFLSLIL